MNRYLLPLKREFWEYRGSFIRLPIISAAVIALLMTAALAIYASNIYEVVFNNDDFHITTKKDFLDGNVHVDIDINEQDSQRQALLTVREELVQTREKLRQNGADFTIKEVENELALAKKDIEKAHQELARAGVEIDVDSLSRGINQLDIKTEVERQIGREIDRLDRQIAALDHGLSAMSSTPPAPEPPVAPSIGDAIRQFPSQVIVIEADQASGFTDDNIESIDEVIKVFFVLFSGLMMIVGFFYLLSCLYTDRKDNSILFWKSMPVSETQQVLTKLATGIFILPSIAVITGLMVSIVFTILSMIYVAGYSTSTTPWELLAGVNLFSFAIQHWLTALGVSLWCLPLFAWLIFASAAARRSPFMLALLPPAALVIAEEIVFNSNWILEVIVQRLPGIAIHDDGEAGFLLFEKAGLNHVGTFLSSPGLWAGLIVAAGLLYATIWLRNNRYEV